MPDCVWSSTGAVFEKASMHVITRPNVMQGLLSWLNNTSSIIFHLYVLESRSVNMSKDIPTCRWGIITTGTISQWFVEDLLLDRPNCKANHIIQAIGTSSIEKGQ